MFSAAEVVAIACGLTLKSWHVGKADSCAARLALQTGSNRHWVAIYTGRKLEIRTAAEGNLFLVTNPRHRVINPDPVFRAFDREEQARPR